MTNSYEIEVVKTAKRIAREVVDQLSDGWGEAEDLRCMDEITPILARHLAAISTDTAPAPAISGGKLIARLAEMTDTECDFIDGFEVRKDARAALAAADRSAAAAPAPDMVSVPRADYERLVYAAECDDNIVKCEICDAWLDREETANIQDFTSCWRGATDRASDPCFRHRSILPAAAPAPQQGESKP